MNNKINYEIDNCTTDLDTLIALDKRAIRDLENNTHEIEQHEVLTIIREFIRLRNDYKQEKEKNKELEEKLKIAKQLYNDACVCIATDCVEKDKIKDMMKYREFELQQEYKEFEEDVEWRTYKKILEDK